MPTFGLVNGVSTTLAASCLAGDTSVTVASSAGFPVSTTYAILIDGEVMYVTDVAGDVWAVTRSAESYAGVQTPAAHAAGALVWCVLTVGVLQAYVSQEALAVLAGLGGVTGYY